MNMEHEESVLSNAQYEDESSLNLSLCRELIRLVKSKELLWKKRCVSYKDQEMKNLCWMSIGNALTPVFSGTVIEKEFYKLRQKFGRKVRKEKESAPRSGAGAREPAYISNWPLYKDLEFLKDVIKPRRTISNLMKNINQRPSASPSPPAIQIKNLSSIKTENNPSSFLWDLDLESNLSPASGSDRDNSSSMSSQMSPFETFPKRSVPTPDFSYVKKKKVQDNIATTIQTRCANLDILTNKITECISVPSTQPKNQSDDLFLAVSAAMSRVPKEKRLLCIIEVLQVVQKYTTEE